MSGRFRPYRSMRSELLTLSLVVLPPLAILFVFPFPVLHPLSPVSARPHAGSCAFVTLTPDQVRKATANARTAWQVDHRPLGNAHINLFVCSLPMLPERPTSGVAPPAWRDGCACSPYVPDALPPTLAAPPPLRIAPQPNANGVKPPFSREELLRLN